MKKLFLILAFVLFAQSAFAVQWQGYNWFESERGGIQIETDVNEARFFGTATTQYWTAESNLYRYHGLVREFSADVRLSNLGATGNDVGLVLTDGVNILGMSKHWGDAGAGWESDCLVAENGVLIAAKLNPPSSDFTNFKIRLTSSGYQAFCNGELLHSGTMTFPYYAIVRLKGSARQIGDQLDASFKNVKIRPKAVPACFITPWAIEP